MPSEKQLWGGETAKAVENFPISGETVPVDGRPLAGPHQGRVRRRQRRAGPALQADAPAVSSAPPREIAAGRPRRTVPDRRLPDRLGHLDEHERQRGHRRPGRRGRAPQRPRQHGPVLQRRVPLGRAPGRARRRPERAAARAEDARALLRPQGQELPEHRQGRPHAPDGRGPGDARPGVRAATPRRSRSAASGFSRRSSTSAQIPLGGTATGTGLNTHPRFAEKVRARLKQRVGPEADRGARWTPSRRRPTATRWSSCPAR